MDITSLDWTQVVNILKALAAIGFGSGAVSLVVAAIVGSSWPSQAKQAVALLTCIIGAFILVLVAGVDLTNLALVIPMMIITCKIVYVKWFKPTGLAPWIETLFFNTGG
jgi:hypothetical protein